MGRPRSDLLAGHWGRCAVAFGALTLATAAAACGSSAVTKSRTASSPPAATRPPRASPQEEHALLAAIKSTRACLDKDGVRASGGPIYPQESPTSPDGQLIVGGAKAGAYVAFYTSASRAGQLEPELRRNASRARVEVERRGTVTLLFFGHPAAKLRGAVSGCSSSAR